MEAKIEAPKTRTFGALHYCIIVIVVGDREYNQQCAAHCSERMISSRSSLSLRHAFFSLFPDQIGSLQAQLFLIIINVETYGGGLAVERLTPVLPVSRP
jgi:hypothetical protein